VRPQPQLEALAQREGHLRQGRRGCDQWPEAAWCQWSAGPVVGQPAGRRQWRMQYGRSHHPEQQSIATHAHMHLQQAAAVAPTSAAVLHFLRRQISCSARQMRGAFWLAYIMSAISEKLSMRARLTYACGE
jgi:hypothetical protein